MSLFKRAFPLLRLFQFRLTTLLLCVVVAGVVFAWWSDRQRLRRELETRDDLISAFRTMRDEQILSRYVVRKGRFAFLSGSTFSFVDSKFDSIEAFLESLRRDPDWLDRASGEWCGFSFKEPAIAKQALPGLFKMLSDKDPQLRRRAVYAIGHIGPRGTDDATQLANSVQDKCKEVRDEALRALQKLKGQAAHVAPLLARMINGDQADDAKLLVETIRAIDPSFDLTTQLVHMLRHRSAETRVVAAYLMVDAESRASSAASAAIDLLSDDIPECRQAAAKAISRAVSPATAMPLLLAAFKNEPDTAVRGSMAQVISDTDRKLTAARTGE